MKLIIQIPCYNEAETLPITLADLPRHVPGFEQVEWLIIDDGSTDKTVQVAQAHGVDHVISHKKNKGLAYAFASGLDACLNLGADVIVNADADNQYNAQDIPLLTTPVLEGKSDIMVGARDIQAIKHFSFMKKILQKLGSWVVRVASGTDIPDAPSGFRAISRNAAKQTKVFSNYTYTLETIIQAGQNNLAIDSVPIRVNKDQRPSRLVKSIPAYIKRSLVTIVRIFVVYRPLVFFMTLSSIFFIAGVIIALHFLWYYLIGQGNGHVQSLILSQLLMVIGVNTGLIGFVADLLATNRKLLEDVRLKIMQTKQDTGKNIEKIQVVKCKKTDSSYVKFTES